MYKLSAHTQSGESIKPFNKYDAIYKVEAIAYEMQKRFTELGYAPFLFIAVVKELPLDRIGEYPSGTDTIIIDQWHFIRDSEEELVDTIIHEMCHMYVDRYHPEATYFHGREFVLLMRKMGIDYDNTHALRNPEVDRRIAVE
jgi:hypothetical protein